jgi:hypothetical protein
VNYEKILRGTPTQSGSFTFTLSVSDAAGRSVSQEFTVVITTSTVGTAHPAGTNVRKSDGTVFMISNENKLRPYSSWVAFTSYGFNSQAAIVDANSGDLALPQGPVIYPADGKVYASTDGTVYLMTAGRKAGFVSASVFLGLGFSFDQIIFGDLSSVPATDIISDTSSQHRQGVLINKAGTVLLVGSTGVIGIPTIAVFDSWGLSFTDVVPSNSADNALSQTGVLAARIPGQMNP